MVNLCVVCGKNHELGALIILSVQMRKMSYKFVI